MDVAEVRRRLRGAIEAARREASERRARSDAAAREYEAFLSERAVPMFQQFAAALAGEGQPFKVFTPAASVRLASERSGEEFIELVLDTSQDPPQVIGRTTRGRGRRMVTSERPVRDGLPIGELSAEDVLAFLLAEIVPFVER
jgi:hypothetical protein